MANGLMLFTNETAAWDIKLDTTLKNLKVFFEAMHNDDVVFD